MNETSVLTSARVAEPVDSLETLGGGYELFGLGWRPGGPAGEYVGRHRSPEA